VARDPRGRTREQVIDDAIEASLGPVPDRQQRADLLQVMAAAGVIVAFAVVVVGLALGLGVGAVTNNATGALVMSVLCVLLVAPLIGLSLVYSVRWFYELRGRKRAPSGSAPDARSQPSDRDLIYAAPIVLMLAAFFLAR